MVTRKNSIQIVYVIEDSKVVLEDGLLQPIPEDVEAELDKILDVEEVAMVEPPIVLKNLIDLSTGEIVPNHNYKESDN